MKALIHITLKEGILDPQGQTIHHALQTLGFTAMTAVRTGKLIEISLAGLERGRAAELVEEACRKLLANPVMEDYSYTIVE
ncbi:MAG: phosphoribosylformylglycinamidine synthase subunit PurS [candidate division KSB1 bacterium]|nr:phosphoribosylformylglycinamidine synthase subunit PurS [candidate division KSB1 bacterium]MDZ7275070.1 phosphoribosylformylglycinamidine synthase subunit PurS [candidate division KSB1 bacterium]MDZ7286482.1 phosphoribosylformylglycinamidine synthase subunit PurS [candidate division KSB1 bacterium]MDZ7299354.1 phosphoribosylformylglycinamidine synthase subunit PurS [candidate division KSB1 bacterium]MDZ7306317.1 phosphoribosylformylglycinamidine synthase subunit PurS [candidate division KSB1